MFVILLILGELDFFKKSNSIYVFCDIMKLWMVIILININLIIK